MTKDIVPLARIFPDRQAATTQGFSSRRVLSPKQKAAVIVRYLLTEGTSLPLASMPEHMQAALAEQMGQMRLIDRTTLDEVVAQFMSELESVGLSFPGGIEGALTMMDGHISQRLAQGLREEMAARGKVKDKDGEEAMATIIAAIRTLEANGEIMLIQPEED